MHMEIYFAVLSLCRVKINWRPTVMLLFMGILGEYLGRVYIEVKRRPLFIVDQVIENKQPSKAGVCSKSMQN